MKNDLIGHLGQDDDSYNADVHIRHLRKTIGVMREQLEAVHFEKDAAVQQAVQHSADEIQQLKNTASSLRDELEKLRFGLKDKLKDYRAEKDKENRHLKNTILMLRTKIEEKVSGVMNDG